MVTSKIVVLILLLKMNFQIEVFLPNLGKYINFAHVARVGASFIKRKTLEKKMRRGFDAHAISTELV